VNVSHETYLQLCERIKDEAGGIACKIGLLDGWLKFQREGGYPILPTQPFILESIRNAHELAVLKVFHLLDANDPDDVSLSRFQHALISRDDLTDAQRDEVTRLGRELKGLRKALLPALKDYRNRKVAHPNVLLPTNPALKILRDGASRVFTLVEDYQRFMHGGLNYEAEVEAYRDSFVGVLHAVSAKSARRALGLTFENNQADSG